MSRQLDLVVQGVVGTNPTLGYTAKNNRAFCRFRVAVTPSHREGETWVDEDTMWLTAKAWGSLARHLAYSLRKGEPVVLVGRLSEEHWSGTKGPAQTNVLTVQCGGHDLTRGETRFVRVTDAAGPSSSASPASSSPDSAEGTESTGGTESTEGTESTDTAEGARQVLGTDPADGAASAEAGDGGGGTVSSRVSTGPVGAAVAGGGADDPWAVSPPTEGPGAGDLVQAGDADAVAGAPGDPASGAGDGDPEDLAGVENAPGYVLVGEDIAGPTEVLMG